MQRAPGGEKLRPGGGVITARSTNPARSHKSPLPRICSNPVHTLQIPTIHLASTIITTTSDSSSTRHSWRQYCEGGGAGGCEWYTGIDIALLRRYGGGGGAEVMPEDCAGGE